jgi:transposase
VIERVQQTLAQGGEVWFGDQTTLREFPPLRCAWARRGEQSIVVVSGRNARRVIHGALNVVTGERVRVVRERTRGEDVKVAVEALGNHHPQTAKLLVLDNAPPHHTKVVREAATSMGIEIAWLPFRSPELNPCEDLWRLLKADVAANRVYTSVDELAEQAVSWLDSLSNDQALRCSGLSSSKFDWLST